MIKQRPAPATPHVEDEAAARMPMQVQGVSVLTFYDKACQALAQAKRFDEVREWSDKAAAVREYARRIRNRQLEIDAAEIRIRADRSRGVLLAELRAAGSLRDGRKAKNGHSESTVSLDDLDTTKNESSQAQKLAAYDGNSFERLVGRWRQHVESEAARVTLDVLKVPPSPGGARSIMASRAEPDDSLDYFPTPPWATRALMEKVLPHIGRGREFKSIWEPACGEGHIAEVLKEYADAVVATDVFDYGYGTVRDFLKDPISTEGKVDWIITNPPFGDKAIEFVQRAHEIAQVGVAMFFRSQWAVEGIERYERIFRDCPPTLCAFFVERVNLCKGRWDPDGTTATAYCWLVWLKGELPRPTFWIPPGQREALTHDDDRERFTARPVAKRAEQQDRKTEAKSQRPEPDAQAAATSLRDDLEIPKFLKREAAAGASA